MSSRISLMVSALFVFCASQVHAMYNDSTWEHMMTRNFGFISPGISWVGIDKFSGQLENMGIAKFRQYAPSVSIGGQKDFGRMAMETQITADFWMDNKNSGIRTSLWVGDILWNTGVNVLPVSLPVTLFPYIGLGVGSNMAHIRSDSKTLAAQLDSINPNVYLMQVMFLLNAGAGADFILSMKNMDKGLVIGIRGGYLFDPYTKNKWHSEGTTISDLPSIDRSGAYVRLVLGGWGKDMHKHHAEKDQQ